MDLSIIIVSWKVRELLEKCLNSIFEQTKNISFEIFVIDNNSDDGTVEMVKEKFPQVHPVKWPTGQSAQGRLFNRVNLIVNNKNEGFSKANNQAIKIAKGKYILLLNPDTVILENAIEKIVDFLQKNPQIGVSGCKLLNADLSLQPSVRCFPTPLVMMTILLKIIHFWPNFGPLKRYLARDFDYDQTAEVDQIMGAFFMIRKQVIEQIGALDEKFWIWFEEVDFCLRAKKAGWKIAYFPDAKTIHYFGQSFKQHLSFKKQKMLNASVKYYFKKHHSYFAYLMIVFAGWVALVEALTIQIFNLKHQIWNQR